jgi:hypothetical protein
MCLDRPAAERCPRRARFFSRRLAKRRLFGFFLAIGRLGNSILRLHAHEVYRTGERCDSAYSRAMSAITHFLKRVSN